MSQKLEAELQDLALKLVRTQRALETAQTNLTQIVNGATDKGHEVQTVDDILKLIPDVQVVEDEGD